MNVSKSVVADVRASLVVFLVALPLCIGIALASGAPLVSGLIAGVVGGVIVGWLSGSSLSVTGPAAGLTSIVVMSVQQLGSWQAFLLSVALAGVLQFLFGVFKAGRIGHYFPHDVIKGMLAAIGIILILKQIPHAVGYDADFEGDESFAQPDGQNTLTEILASVDNLTLGAVIISTLSILLLLFWNGRRMKKLAWARAIPGEVVVVALSVLITFFYDVVVPSLSIKPEHLVKLPDSFSAIQFMDLSAWQNPMVYKIALTIALVSSIETILSIDAIDNLDTSRKLTPLNRELKAQGAGNFLSGLLGGLPVTSVIVRGSANFQAGAQTKFSTILHGVWLFVFVAFLPFVIERIPLAALAAILLLVGYKLASFAVIKEMYRKGWTTFIPFAVTVLMILLTDLLMGVLAGIVVSVFFILRSNLKKGILVVEDGNQVLIRLSHHVSFLNKATLRESLYAIPSSSKVVIDGSRAYFVDDDIKSTLRNFLPYAAEKNINVELIKLEV